MRYSNRIEGKLREKSQQMNCVSNFNRNKISYLIESQIVHQFRTSAFFLLLLSVLFLFHLSREFLVLDLK